MKYYAGVDLGGTSAKIGLVDISGNIIEQDTVNINRYDVFSDIIRPIAEQLKNLKKRTSGELSAIGIGTPGFTDSETGVLISGAENITCLKGNSLSVFLSKELKAPAFADNDATCAAAGELKFGVGKGYKNFALITLGTGIGGGLVLNGRVFRGTRGFAAETGHICINPSGIWCNCGSRGCFEKYASAPAMQRMYHEKCMKRGINCKKDVGSKEIFLLASKGDELAKAVVDETARAVAQVFGMLINLLNLQACIIGGGISKAGNLILKPVQSHIHDFAWPLLVEGVKIHIAALSNNAGMLGAAAQAIERING